jgi:hypothetical protein
MSIRILSPLRVIEIVDLALCNALTNATCLNLPSSLSQSGQARLVSRARPTRFNGAAIM